MWPWSSTKDQQASTPSPEAASPGSAAAPVRFPQRAAQDYSLRLPVAGDDEAPKHRANKENLVRYASMRA